MEKLYNKLVRDNIPEIIKANGQIPIVRVLDNDKYLSALNIKLQEEVSEYMTDNCLNELCDIIEVVYSIAIAKGFSENEVHKARLNKKIKNGAFEKRLFLEKVILEDK